MQYTRLKIIKFSFLFLLDLNNISREIPLPVNNPDSKEENLITPLVYNSVIIILEPQLGIKPTKPLKNGVISELL